MLELDNVTLFSVDCKQPEKAVIAINESLKDIKFGEVLFFSNKKPVNLTDNIRFIKIRNITDKFEYSKFMIQELPNHINTDFAMCVQHDGWIINPEKWKDEFLDYDYIGAPWPNLPWVREKTLQRNNKKYRVGNGGVSIRSKKLMTIIQNLAPSEWFHEDIFICFDARDILEQNNIKFAPLKLASQFSLEKPSPDLDVLLDEIFAFHEFHTHETQKKSEYMNHLYIRDVITKFSVHSLIYWLKHEAGSQQPDYFFGAFRGGLLLQQIPFEYANLLNTFRTNGIKSYLELGVGNGGSFFVDCMFIGNECEKFHAVDNIGYANTHIKQTEEKILDKVKMVESMMPESEVKFFNSTTDDFFEKNDERYDCIFIDADHSYRGVKQDYINSLKCINDDGIIIFHDIGNKTTGVAKCWEEVKNNAKKIEEYLWKPDDVENYNCGIGIYYV